MITAKSAADVVLTLRRLAADMPDYTYTPPEPYSAECCYVHRVDSTRVAGCAVGQALAAVGVPLKWLEKSEGEMAANVLFQLFPESDWVDMNWCDAFQKAQDSGVPWGECAQRANDYYPNATKTPVSVNA